MSSHPHTIDNGAGEVLTFVGVRRDERGEYLEARNSVAPGSGPPMHAHQLQEESLTVEQGTIAYQLHGQAKQTAAPGATVTFPPGDAHRFWNDRDEELVCTGLVRPPGNVEYFLTQLYASTKSNGGKRPALLEAAYLSHRYRAEFELVEIPAPVRRIAFPLLAALARVLGAHRRFADAPEPMARP